MRFSAEGTTYIPKGQCLSFRNDAYSSETAVRATGLTVSAVADDDGRSEEVRGFGLKGTPRSNWPVPRAPSIV